ncbi:MAG: hypoxanthine phosphoribosyltransferase [Anaerolineae bacterium]|nr:hypoxanthine phosphoribosyltransferase [Anaerolineae bacterium]
MPDNYRLSKGILIDEDTLQDRIEVLGGQINHDYAGMTGLLLVCVLKGGVLFLTDLMRRIHVPHAIDFMAVSSYGVGQRETSGVVRIDMDLRQSIEGKHLLIVEDIVDTGTTLNYLKGLLQSRQPASIKICALLNKPSRRVADIHIDYIGFDIPDVFVYGYGLDLDELYRNLPYVAIAK